MAACPPFAVAVLDLVQPGATGADAGADILSTAIAAEIPVDAPSSTQGKIRRHFVRLLKQLHAHAETRAAIEAAIAAVFTHAAAKDFAALNALD